MQGWQLQSIADSAPESAHARLNRNAAEVTQKAKADREVLCIGHVRVTRQK
jgi:hypothetical protein